MSKGQSLDFFPNKINTFRKSMTQRDVRGNTESGECRDGFVCDL